MNNLIFLDFLTDRELEIYNRHEREYESVYDGVVSIIEKTNERIRRSKSSEIT